MTVASRWAVVAATVLCLGATRPPPPTSRPTSGPATRPTKLTPDEIAAMIPADLFPEANGQWPLDRREAARAALEEALAGRVIVMRATLRKPYNATAGTHPVDAHARGVAFLFNLRVHFAKGEDLSGVREGDERWVGGVVGDVEIDAHTFHAGVAKWKVTVDIERARARP